MITAFTLQSPATNASAQFSLGHAFKKGDVPSGSQVVADIADFQCVPKNVWQDGSLKFAALSGRASLTANVVRTIALSLGSPTGGTDLTTADLKATGITASIAAGAFGSASWATTDWDSPFMTWVSGPQMSSWIYRKAVGGDAHLVAWLRVRLFANGAVEVLPWIENGYMNVAGPTNKSATYSFTLNAVSKFSQALDLKSHSRTPLINGTALSYWNVTDPLVTWHHDTTYMQATEMVPTYSAEGSSVVVNRLVTSFAPFQAGNIVFSEDFMPNTGYAHPIGLLPEYDVAYLVCSTDYDKLLAGVIRNGFSVGRYPIHFRDETTNRPPRFSTYPTLVIQEGSGLYGTGASTTGTRTPTVSGGVVAGWDLSHCPSVGYMAYLVTADWYHLETAQFACTSSYFNTNDYLEYPNTTLRFVPNYGAVQTRTAAWGARTLVQALAITPDADANLKGEFAGLVEDLVDYFHAVYVAQPNNQFGFIMPGDGYGTLNGAQLIAPWQQDFFTAAYGYALALDLPIGAPQKAKLSEFFHWKAKSVVGRFGASTDFWYINGAAFKMVMGDTAALPDYMGGTGPWHTSWNHVYTDTIAAPMGAAWYTGTGVGTPVAGNMAGTTEGMLCGEYSPVYWATGQWGNMFPALAYARRFGVDGAEEAYSRIASASNFSVFADAFGDEPVWSVMPASIPAPAESAPMGPTLNIDVVSRFPGKLVIGNTGLGVLGANVAGPVNGVPGYMYGVFDDVLHADREVSGPILTRPSAGNFKAREDGAYSFTDAPDGIYNFTFQPTVGNTPYGPVLTEELVVGGTQAVAAWTEGADIIAVAATFASGVGASIAWTEGADVIAAAATVTPPVQALIVWTEGADVIAATAFVVAQPEDVFHVSPSCTVNFDGGTNRVDF